MRFLTHALWLALRFAKLRNAVPGQGACFECLAQWLQAPYTRQIAAAT
jgi:hypothetical protein